MTSVSRTRNAIAPFYPAYTFSSSPTWFTWVKLTCNSIHRDLLPHPDFPPTLIDAPAGNSNAKPLLLFYQNHPIQFVQVIGIAVAIEDAHPSFTLLTVDDGTGATIDVIYWKPRPKAPIEESQNGYGDAKTSKTPTEDVIQIEALLPTLKIGSCIQAKGTITEFRGTRQLLLLRLATVPTTTAELRLINARSTFYTDILSKPWILSPSRLRRLEEKAKSEKAQDSERSSRARKRVQARLDRDQRHEMKILRQSQKEDEERAKQLLIAKRAGEELKHSILKRRRSG